MADVARHLEQAARLRTLVAIGRARTSSRSSTSSRQSIDQPGATMQPETYPEPDDQAQALAAELLASAMLRADGTTFDESTPEGCSEMIDAEADGHEPELVNLGGLRVQIVDAEANALALAVGAIDADSPPTLCVRARIEAHGDTPEPEAGQIVVLPTTEEGVWLTFRVWLTYDFVNAPPPAEFDLGPGAARNPAFDELQRDEVLLVQLLDGEIREAGL